MDAFEYTFTSKLGDRYIIKIQNDGFRFLSSSMLSILDSSELEVWGIYLNRVGSYKNVTSIRDLSVISKQIYSFFMSHENVILYYVCDDIAEVPMNNRKKAIQCNIIVINYLLVCSRSFKVWWTSILLICQYV